MIEHPGEISTGSLIYYTGKNQLSQIEEHPWVLCIYIAPALSCVLNNELCISKISWSPTLIDGIYEKNHRTGCIQEISCKEGSFLSIETLVNLWWSLRNSTTMKVRADAGTYHAILGTPPLNIPFTPSTRHTLLRTSNHPLYLGKYFSVKNIVVQISWHFHLNK